MSYLKQTSEGIRLQIHVQPNASKNQIVGRHGDALKIKIKSVPEDGKANAELISFLAKTLGVAKSQVELISGQTSRAKGILVRGLDIAALEQLLNL